MKQRIVRLLLFLLLGAIVNVAVASSLWFWGERPAPGAFETKECWSPTTAQERANWERYAGPDWPAAPKECGHYARFGKRFNTMIAVVNDFDPSNLGTDEWVEKAKKRESFALDSTFCGWPLMCTSIHQAEQFHRFPPSRGFFHRSGGQIGRYSIPDFYIWPGFAINTVFYAAALWVLSAAPGWIRRRIRI